MSKQTAQGSPDGPKYIYGKENVNWAGPKQANPDNEQLSSSDVRSDFNTPDTEAQVEATARSLMEDYWRYPEDLPNSYLEEFITSEHNFDVDDLGDFVRGKLRMISDAIQENKHEDEDFIASLYEGETLEKGSLAYTSKQVLDNYLRSPEDLTDHYVGEFVSDTDPFDVEQLREAAYEIVHTVSDRIEQFYED